MAAYQVKIIYTESGCLTRLVLADPASCKVRAKGRGLRRAQPAAKPPKAGGACFVPPKAERAAPDAAVCWRWRRAQAEGLRPNAQIPRLVTKCNNYAELGAAGAFGSGEAEGKNGKNGAKIQKFRRFCNWEERK